MFPLRTQPALRRAVFPSCVRLYSSGSFPQTDGGPTIIKQYGQHKKEPRIQRPSPPPGRTIFSGIQPTGVPHLGNYLGALREWVKLQRDAGDGDRAKRIDGKARTIVCGRARGTIVAT